MEASPSSSETSDDLFYDLEEVEHGDRPRTSRQKKSTKRSRLINLRSRISQNLTQDSDFISVLDSLKVERNANQSESEVKETSSGQSVDLGPNLEILDSKNEQKSSNEANTNLEAEKASSLAQTSNSLKCLTTYKRKIEQNDDFYQPKRSQSQASEQSDECEEFGFNKSNKDEKEKKEKKRNYRSGNSKEPDGSLDDNH